MTADPNLKRVYEMIGEIATSWNEVELLWYLIFTCLMKETPRPQVDAVYSMFETGSMQRSLILAVADTVYPPDHAGRPNRQRRRLGQLSADTNDAAGNRNAAIHAVITKAATQAKPEYFASAGIKPNKPNRLSGKQLEKELEGTINQISTLSGNLERFLDTITPKLEAPPEMLESLRKLGFQVPSWIVERPSPPSDQKDS